MGALRVSLCSTDDHLFVPTCVPWRKAASGGQGWPKVTAERREASLRAAGRLATLTTVGSLGEASASRDPYRAREAEPGSPSKTVIANPADIVALLTPTPPELQMHPQFRTKKTAGSPLALKNQGDSLDLLIMDYHQRGDECCHKVC